MLFLCWDYIFSAIKLTSFKSCKRRNKSCPLLYQMSWPAPFILFAWYGILPSPWVLKYKILRPFYKNEREWLKINDQYVDNVSFADCFPKRACERLISCFVPLSENGLTQLNLESQVLIFVQCFQACNKHVRLVLFSIRWPDHGSEDLLQRGQGWGTVGT